MLASCIRYYRYRVATIRSESVMASVEWGWVIRKSFRMLAGSAVGRLVTSGCGV